MLCSWKEDAYKDQLVCRICDSHKLLPSALSALAKQTISSVSEPSSPEETVTLLAPVDMVPANEEQMNDNIIRSIENMSTISSEFSD